MSETVIVFGKDSHQFEELDWDDYSSGDYVIIRSEDDIPEFDPDDLEDQYDELLDEIYEPMQIGDCGPFYPSKVLKECDPIAYRICLSEYADSRREDLVDEYNHMR